VTDQSDAATASPAPDPSLRVEDRHPSTQQVMRYFEYSHLRNDLAVVPKEFHTLAHRLLCQTQGDTGQLVRRDDSASRLMTVRPPPERIRLTAPGVLDSPAGRPVPIQNVQPGRCVSPATKT
jgi:hypothetical protein